MRAAPVALLLIVVVAGAWLRFADLGERDLWIDEVVTCHVARAPLGEAARFVRTGDVAPPFAYALARASIAACERLLGTEAALRLPSALAGALSPLVLFWLSRRRGDGRRVALVAAALLAVHARAVEHARDARFYALEVLLACGFLLASERGSALGFALAGAALVWNQTLALFFVAAEVLARRPRVAVLVALAVLLAPFGLLLVPQFERVLVAENVRHHVSGRDFEGILRELAGVQGPTRSRLAVAVFLPLLAAGAAASWRARRRDLARAVLGLGLPLGVFLVLPPTQLYPRYFEYLLPLAILFQARGAAALADRAPPRGRRVAFAALAALLLLAQRTPLRDYERALPLPYRAALAAIESRVAPGDRVLVLFAGGHVGEAAAELMGFEHYAGPRVRPLLASAFEDGDARPTWVLVTLKRRYAVSTPAVPGASVLAPRILLLERAGPETPAQARARARPVLEAIPSVPDRALVRTFGSGRAPR